MIDNEVKEFVSKTLFDPSSVYCKQLEALGNTKLDIPPHFSNVSALSKKIKRIISNLGQTAIVHNNEIYIWDKVVLQDEIWRQTAKKFENNHKSPEKNEFL